MRIARLYAVIIQGLLPLRNCMHARMHARTHAQTCSNRFHQTSHPSRPGRLPAPCTHAQTTLMDVIAGRKTIGEITGDILVNGHPKDQRSWARWVGERERGESGGLFV